MIRLPVSGVRARWLPPSGHEDIMLADGAPGLAGLLPWIGRSVVDANGAALDATALPAGDLDRLVVTRRRELRGDSFVAEGSCASCAAGVDVDFSLASYLEHHRPRRPRNVVADEPGWWRLGGRDVIFRVPLVADVLAAADAEPPDDPRTVLLGRCVRNTAGSRHGPAVERAMAALAPTLRTDVRGTCPECGADVLLDVDARELCLAEMRFLAGSVYDDVHLIASAYGWSQEAILDLPSARRRRYAELIADGRDADLLDEVHVG